jgi:hypothetical protein
MARRFFTIVSLMLVTTGALASTADAQVLGTFRWQLAPHCNVLTLTVEQRGAGYRLDGTDDLCGAPVQAAASGTAHLNPNGSVSIAVAVTRPDGNAIQQSLSVILPGLSGIWTDDVGNRGSLIFAPAVPAAGSPRQITLRGNYGVDFLATAAGPFDSTGVAEISFTRVLPAAPIPHVVTSPTTECPGSTPLPEAAPGHLCVYVLSTSNVGTTCVASAEYGMCGTANRTGAVLLAISTSAARTWHIGTWAVTLP